jgi:hypothetical protein
VALGVVRLDLIALVKDDRAGQAFVARLPPLLTPLPLRGRAQGEGGYLLGA